MRTLVEKIARRFGLVVIPDWRFHEVALERHLRRLFDYLSVDCVFDVGANVGQFAQMLRKNVEYRGPIISFEPNPDALAVLQTRAADDSLWRIKPVALGATARKLHFNAYEYSTLASFCQLKQSSAYAQQGKATKVLELTTETLARHLAEAHREWSFRRPFLKIDTQGFDLEVAQGAGRDLSEFVGIQTEVAFIPMYESAPSYASTLEFFEEAGFAVSAQFPVHEGFFPIFEMDMLLVRRDN